MNPKAIVLASLLAVTAGLALPASSAAQDTATEGVQVHGAWTIEVRDPDGTLVDRRTFENALVAPEAFATTLAGAAVLNLGAIALTDCIEDGGVATTCYIQGSKTVPTSGDDAGALVITGSLVASLPTVGSASVTQVATWGALCPGAVAGDIAPVNCGIVPEAGNLSVTGSVGSQAIPVTATTLASPVAVSDGQTLSVRVVISFS